MRNLNKKVAVITGAGSGIGRFLAINLANENTHLALIDINKDTLMQTKEIINNKSDRKVKVELYELDISILESVQIAAENIINTFGHIDILINNAGVSGNTSDIQFQEMMMKINLWGTVYLTKSLLPHLLTRKEASIVNISSVYGLFAMYGHAGYCMSKYAVKGYTELLQLELYNTNISVIIVYPSGIKTNVVRNAIVDKTSPEMREKQIESIEKTLTISPDIAAKKIIKGIKKKSIKVFIGKDAIIMDKLSRHFPKLCNLIVRQYSKKFQPIER